MGGLSSISVELRRGYLLTFKLILEKFKNILNFNDLLIAIEKETNVSKSETNYVRNCANSGRIIMLQQILEIPSLPMVNISRILRVLFEILLHNKHFEETIIFVIDKFFNRIYNNFYTELNFENTKNLTNIQKNFNKTLSTIFETMEKYITGNKNQIEDSNKIYEFSLYFLIAKMYLKAKNSANLNKSTSTSTLNTNESTKDKIIVSLIESYYGLSFSNKIIEEGTVLGFFKLIVKNSTPNETEKKAKEDNKSLSLSLDLFFEILKLNKEKEKVYKIWNLIIDENTNQILSEISPKNFQYLIYYVSRFILKSFFHLDYVKQIFEATFFISFLRFKLKQKFKFLGNLIEIVMEHIEKIKSKEANKNNEDMSKKISDYCLNLLNLFGNEPENNLSIQTFKTFYAVKI
jgi:hypothetical protein